jgi:hypothetical protein
MPQSKVTTFTGSISGTTLTTPANAVIIGSVITGVGVLDNTYVTATTNSTTWTVNNSQTVASETLTQSVFPPGHGTCIKSDTSATALLTVAATTSTISGAAGVSGATVPIKPGGEVCLLATVSNNYEAMGYLPGVALTLAISLNPATATDPASTPTGANLSFITVTVSDGSQFHGTVAFGGTAGDGGGVCVLVGASTTLAAPTANTLVDSDGTWSFGATLSGAGGYPLQLNGTQVGGGFGVLFVSYNGSTYAENLQGAWFQWNGTGWPSIAGDPRPPGSGALALAKMEPAGSYNCGIVATQ